MNLKLNPSSYYSINLQADYKKGAINQSINTKKTSVNASFNLRHWSDWGSSVFVESLSYEDSRNIFDYQQTYVGLTLTKDLI